MMVKKMKSLFFGLYVHQFCAGEMTANVFAMRNLHQIQDECTVTKRCVLFFIFQFMHKWICKSKPRRFSAEIIHTYTWLLFLLIAGNRGTLMISHALCACFWIESAALAPHSLLGHFLAYFSPSRMRGRKRPCGSSAISRDNLPHLEVAIRVDQCGFVFQVSIQYHASTKFIYSYDYYKIPILTTPLSPWKTYINTA